MKNEKWFALDIKQIEKKLKTNAASGLSLKAARSRWNHNIGTLFVPQKRSPISLLGSLFTDFALILLLLTAVIAIFFDDSYSVIAILALALLNLCVSFVIYFRSQRTLESMESFYRPTARVVRGGKLYNVDYNHVVMGDVLLLERGDVVCADVRIVTSDSLGVSMRVNENDYIYLEKLADGVIRPNENDPKNYSNIIHAGSIIEQGSARVIVVATGKYTYLGAMTGGIIEKNRDNIPEDLKKLKRFCSRLGMISLLSVLPFCIISFFLSQTQGAEVTLSIAFLTALAISASVTSQSATTICKIFFVNNIKKMVLAKDSAAIRSCDALERFAKADYLFVLDGSPFTDPESSFESAMTFDGEISNFDNLNKTAMSLANAVGIYSLADKRTLSAGISENEEYEKGIDEFCRLCKVDKEGLCIRYSKIARYPAVMQHIADSVIYTENGVEKLVCVSLESAVIRDCQTAYIGSASRQFGLDGAERLERFYNDYISKGKKVVIITVLNMQTNERSFMGMLSFGNGVDRDISKKILFLEKMGINPIIFSCNSDIALPQIPLSIDKIPSTSIAYMRDNGIPITSNFGKYRHYKNAEEKDILELIEYARSKRKRVAILGFSDFAAAAIEKADVFISCAPVRPKISGYLYEEIHSLETEGGAFDSSCIQMVKNEVDVLVPRYQNGRGGFNSLIAMRKAGLCAYRNLKQFVRYMVCVQFIRICAVAIPMLFGSIALDARHVLFGSFFMDLTALLIFSISNDVYNDQKGIGDWWDSKIKPHIKEDKILFISAISAVVMLVMFPRIIGLIGGQYLCEEGCSFSALIYLHLAVFFILRHGLKPDIKKVVKDIPTIVFAIVTLGLLTLLFAIEAIRPIFSLEMGNPFPYFLISFIPAATFVLLYCFINYKTGNKK